MMFHGLLRATSELKPALCQARVRPGVDTQRERLWSQQHPRSRGCRPARGTAECLLRMKGVARSSTTIEPGPRGRCRGSRRRWSPRSRWPRELRRHLVPRREQPHFTAIAQLVDELAQRLEISSFEYTSHRLTARDAVGRSKSRSVAMPTDPKPMNPTCSSARCGLPLESRRTASTTAEVVVAWPVVIRGRSWPASAGQGRGHSRWPRRAIPSVTPSPRRSRARAGQRRRGRPGGRAVMVKLVVEPGDQHRADPAEGRLRTSVMSGLSPHHS